MSTGGVSRPGETGVVEKLAAWVLEARADELPHAAVEQDLDVRADGVRNPRQG